MNNPRFDAQLDHIRELHNRKNDGYAGSVDDDPYYNFRQCERIGIPADIGVFVRLTDKFSRLASIIKNPDNDKVGESVMDTLDDIAVYALIMKDLYSERLQRPPGQLSFENRLEEGYAAQHRLARAAGWKDPRDPLGTKYSTVVGYPDCTS